MKYYWTLLLGFVVLSAQAQVLDLYQAQRFQNEKGELLYRIMSPANVADDQKYPLVIFLHGSGERGNNNQSQLTHVADNFADPEIRMKYPAFVVFPQCPEGSRWSNGDFADGVRSKGIKMADSPSREGSLVMGLIEQLSRELPVDKDRVYLAGLSMGGYGTWDLMIRYPDTFAAVVPVCGAGDPGQVAKAAKIPVWAAHGSDDFVVPVETTRLMIEALRKAGASPVYTEFLGVGHNSWDPMFEDNKLIFDWMFSQKK